jgi:hypothetical protein
MVVDPLIKPIIPSMNKNFKNTIAIASLLFFSTALFGQHHLQLGTLSTFDAYTGKGAVTNDGTLTNDAGSNDGIIDGIGFDSSYHSTIFSNDSTTIQARIDLLRVYIHLSKIFVTHPGSHAPAFCNTPQKQTRIAQS